MPITDDIIRINLFFSQDGNEGLITSYFRYQQAPSIGGVTEELVAEAYFTAYKNIIRPATLHTSAAMVRCVVDNLTTALLYGEYSEVANGVLTGDPAPSFVAIDVKQNVTSRLTRSGRKRLPFTAESISNGDVCTIEGTDLSNIEEFFGDPLGIINPLDSELVGYIHPVIVKRVETPPDSGHYVPDPAQWQLVSSAQVIGMTSQVSRKP